MEKKSVVIFGPFGEQGGRELEAGFIGQILTEHYNVQLCSTGYISKNSQVFDFLEKSQVTSFRNELFRSSVTIQLLSIFSFLKNFGQREFSYYANNAKVKSIFEVNKRINSYWKRVIEEHDIIILCAQLSSRYIKEIVEYAYLLNIPVIFRTTGKIDPSQIQDSSLEWMKKVNFFIHHSNLNLGFLPEEFSSKNCTIDQCAFYEEDFLTLPIRSKTVRRFITCARLVKEKNIDVVIHAFLLTKEEGDQLLIVGDGPDSERLKSIAGNDQDIVFKGFVPRSKLGKVFSTVDCAIIPKYSEEAGPLTGVEAMAAGKIIISSRTGAMPERLNHLGLWFEFSIEDLMEQIKKAKNLSNQEVYSLGNKIRNKYKEAYSRKKIGAKYLEVVEKCLGT